MEFPCSSIDRLIEFPADSEHVPVRMPDMHLPHIPGHVGWRPCHLESLFDTTPIDGIDVVDPDRHPHALVSRVVTVRSERFVERASTPPALGVLTQENLALAGTDTAER